MQSDTIWREAEGIFIPREALRYIYLEGGSTVYLSGGRQYGVFASFEAIRQLGSSGLGASPTPYPRT